MTENGFYFNHPDIDKITHICNVKIENMEEQELQKGSILMFENANIHFVGEKISNGLPVITFSKAVKEYGREKLTAPRVHFGNIIGVVLPLENGGFIFHTLTLEGNIMILGAEIDNS